MKRLLIELSGMPINIAIQSKQDISRPMKTLQIAVVILATVGSRSAFGCPFAKTNNEQNLPDDDNNNIHRRSLRRRLSDTLEAKGKLKSIIDNRTKEQQKYRSNKQQNERSIGGSGGQAVSTIYNHRYFPRHMSIIHSSSTPYSSHTYIAFTNYRRRRSNSTILTCIRS